MSEEKKPLADLMASFAEEMEKHAKRYTIGHEIVWPLEVSGVEFRGALHGKGRTDGCKVGQMVMVRMCDKTKATHLGVYLGEFPMQLLHQFDKETKRIEVFPNLNPAMLVPKLGRIVWGCESFWGPIESENQLRQVTDAEISDIWYIKALKELSTEKV